MNQHLANALREGADWIEDVFYEGFQTSQQWIAYINDHFPNRDVGEILNKERGWSAEEFQALYIACWIYKPVVKGSYMLRLSNEHLPNVKHAYKKMPGRWSSHLHKEVGGISAGEGWRFLKGYHELLAQIEDTIEGEYLFLKCEGHLSTHPSHIKSYFCKKTHGVGLEANPELEELVKDQPGLGIKARRAENYSSNYKALIKTIGYKNIRKKQGEIISIQEAIGAMIREMRDTAKSMGSKGVELTAWLKRQLQPFGITIDNNNVTWYGLVGVYNDQYAHLLDIIMRFGTKAQNTLGTRINEHPFLVALCAAMSDLRSIQRELLKDMDRGNVETTRFFEEVNVTPEWLNYGLQKALNLLL